MSAIQQLLTDHLDIWTAADTEKKSGRGRSSGTAGSVYGVKELRELILELAVRGKLVPQDEKDEPASELLKRIVAEKAKLVAEGKIKKTKPLAEITDDEKPFELPMGWELVKLGTLCYKLTDGSHNPPKDAGTGFPMLSSQNVNFGKIDFNSPSRYVNADDFDVENSRTKIESGDVLLTIVASLGRPAVVPNNAPKFVLQRSVAVIKTDLMSEFLCLHLGSPLCVRYYDIHAKGTAQKGIYLGQLSEMPIVVPPIKEQHRIVAKVDELMTLCDQLENQHNNAAVAHEKLVTQLLGTLTQSQNAEDFNTHWQRISEHFDTLFTTEASIDALKQTLLQLAVMGKLVPQDPNDEPASELLKRIQAEKAKLIAEGKIKKDKPLAVITEEEKPFDLPVGWEWARLGDISQLKGGMAYQSSAFVETGKNQVIRMGNVRPWRLRIDEKAVFIDNSVADKTMEYSLNIDDIVITMTGTIGKRDYVYSARIHESDVQHKKLFLNQRLCSVRPYLMKPRYLDMAMKDDRLLDVIFSNATGTANQANISMAALNLWLIPIPPIKEQNFIVTKVDELLALCNQLKASITSANQLQQKLADVLVERLI